MATTITERPHALSFSKNEVLYILNVTDPATPGCAVDFELYYETITNPTGVLLVAFTLSPNADGSIYCHLQSYLRSILTFEMPDPAGAAVQPISAQVKKFYIKYRQVTTADPDTAWISDDDNKKLVFLGGVEHIKFKRNNFFVSYQVLTKPFLTWQPSGRFVFIDQIHFLTFLLTTATASFDVVYKTVFTDGTDHTSSVTYSTVGDPNLLFRIKTGAKALGLDAIDPAKRIHYYEIKIVDADSEVLANAYRFYINYYPVYDPHDFVYENSLGGLDGIRVRGEIDWDVQVTSNDKESINEHDDHASIFPGAQYGEMNISRKDVWKGDIGFLQTKREQEAMIELLMNANRYEWLDGRWIPVLSLKKSFTLRSNADKKWSFPIEWSYAYDEDVYTPTSILLGAGADEPVVDPDPPVCTPVVIHGFALANGIVGDSYNAEFELTGDAPFELTVTVKPTWMTIAISGNTVTFTGTPDAEADDLEVSFNISNCEGGSIDDFSDIIDVIEPTIETGKNAVVINPEHLNLQLLSHGNNYPASPSTSNFSVNILQGTAMEIVTPIGVSCLVEFFTSFGMSPVSIYSTTVSAGTAINLDPDPNHATTGVNNINYIRIAEV